MQYIIKDYSISVIGIDEIEEKQNLDNYRELVVPLGSSQYVNSVVARFFESEQPNEPRVQEIVFDYDDDYEAYIITDAIEVPEDYELVAAGKTFVKIYDDEGLTVEINCPHIEIYRAGEEGCLIRLIGGEYC